MPTHHGGAHGKGPHDWTALLATHESVHLAEGFTVDIPSCMRRGRLSVHLALLVLLCVSLGRVAATWAGMAMDFEKKVNSLIEDLTRR